MLSNTESILLKIGNETVKSMASNYILLNLMPKEAWQVSFTVENNTLKFKIFLDYAKFFKSFRAIEFADPYIWIPVVAATSAENMMYYVSSLNADLRFLFTVNSSDNGKDCVASCTVLNLYNVYPKLIGITFDEIMPIIMPIMDP